MYRNIFFDTFIVVLFIALIPLHTAYAYLDAGTGSIIMQAVIAGVVGSLFAIKIFWNKIKSFLLKFFRKNA